MKWTKNRGQLSKLTMMSAIGRVKDKKGKSNEARHQSMATYTTSNTPLNRGHIGVTYLGADSISAPTVATLRPGWRTRPGPFPTVARLAVRR